jgi:hypothetical protein
LEISQRNTPCSAGLEFYLNYYVSEIFVSSVAENEVRRNVHATVQKCLFPSRVKSGLELPAFNNIFNISLY